MSKVNDLIGISKGYGNSHCCGCEACSVSCPKQCLEMQTDSQGFYYPVFSNQDACIDCGLCSLVCPVLNPYDKKPRNSCSAAYSDEVDRQTCSSGGINTLVAKHVIQQGGVVFGARFNSDWDVVMDFTEKLSDLHLFSSSKYVQAYPNGVFKKVLSYLRQDRIVLFTGLPCQVSGLKHFLKKDYSNLITISCLCHSVPSPKVWRKFLNENCNEDMISSFNFRDKSNGWQNYSFKVKYANGHEQNIIAKKQYMDAMLKNLSTRPSCSSCLFKGGKSHADIELGDCWGAETICPDFYDEEGMNIVITYSLKGQQLLDNLSLKSQAININESMRFNEGLSKSTPIHPNQRWFFKLLNHMKFNKAVSICLCTSKMSMLKHLLLR